MSVDLETLKKQAWQQRENYIAALTDVAIAALRDAGLHITYGSREAEGLHDAIASAAR